MMLAIRQRRGVHTRKVPAENLPAETSASPPTDAVPSLPLVELCVYVVTIVVVMSLIFYNVYLSSREYVDAFSSYMLEPGWSVLGNSYKDVADLEWSYWVAIITPVTLLIMLGYMSLGRVVDYIWPQFRKHFVLGYSVLCLTGMLSVQAVCVFVIYALAVYLASRTKSAAVVWVVVILEICSTNLNHVHLKFLFEEEDLFNQVVFGLAMCQLRLLSFGLSYCGRKETSSCYQPTGVTSTFFDLMVYIFYLPLFASGPIMTYNSFSEQINQPPRPFSRDELRMIMKEFLRYTFWGFFIEFALHLMYFPAFHQVWYIFQFLPCWSLGGIGLCHLLFFQVKYLVTYGIPRTIALLDRIEAPLGPVCVLGMHTFQDMWKYFDRGLHSLLISTIYIPLGGSRHGLVRSALASFTCFSFVWFWHGTEYHLLYWALFSWLGVIFEITMFHVGAWLGVQEILKSRLSSSWYCRLLGVYLTPTYMMLAHSNLVFLGGRRVAYTYYYRFVVTGWPWPFLTVFFSFYCVIQVTRALHQHYGKNYLCKKLYAT